MLMKILEMQVQMEHGGSSSSLTSLTVESVLECFDFLDNEESDGNRTRPGSPSSELGKKVTFSPQLDMTLLIHLMYSRHLVEVKRPDVLKANYFPVDSCVFSFFIRMVETCRGWVLSDR